MLFVNHTHLSKTPPKGGDIIKLLEIANIKSTNNLAITKLPKKTPANKSSHGHWPILIKNNYEKILYLYFFSDAYLCPSIV